MFCNLQSLDSVNYTVESQEFSEHGSFIFPLLCSNQDNKLGLNRRETFIGQMRRILSKTQLQVPQALVATPIKELGKHRVVDMSLGPTHSCVVVETGRVYTFGRNSEGQLCTGNLLPKNMPSAVKGLRTKPMVSELAFD